MSKQVVRISTNESRTIVEHNGDMAVASICQRRDGTIGLALDGNVQFYGASLREHRAELEAATLAAIGQIGYDATLTYGIDKDNTAELDAYETGYKATVGAMTLDGHTY